MPRACDVLEEFVSDQLSCSCISGEVGPRVLYFYEEFFDVQYPLPKQDMVALPDFMAGAMENWGLITYRYCLIQVVIYRKPQIAHQVLSGKVSGDPASSLLILFLFC
jgi:hypothetical protein